MFCAGAIDFWGAYNTLQVAVRFTKVTPGRLHIIGIRLFRSCVQAGEVPNRAVGDLLRLGFGYSLPLIGLELELDAVPKEVDRGLAEWVLTLSQLGLPAAAFQSLYSSVMFQ